eukprot:CAMPEP_0118686370 /NCGR_PEP_ID=MMETSP0800-20121206/7773_1 /TAXON_ID=210618 ORGANISM="Striatella unipunctata, Strain CCMP2910" /NCGR_SAMPLE_ID=MMETSP0800 /ASSEMBLY_ACC=CAM_ASM_000638 /LENGTH=111 /DNA_ID=CAMNT_0006583403 /DNA_START=189 /DNA_END=524 /DNA_ORIENTATION=+
MDFQRGAGFGGGGDGFDLMSWYMEIPVVSRTYFTGAFLTTAACAVDIISPFSLYFNWSLIFKEGQVWRLVTTYLFFGMFSILALLQLESDIQGRAGMEAGDYVSVFRDVLD